MIRLLRKIQVVVAPTALLAVPTFAFVTLLTSSPATTVELPAADDPIRRDFLVIESPVSAGRAAAITRADRSADEEEEVIATNWRFTKEKGKPSPYR